MISLAWFRTSLVFLSVLVFFTNFSDYSQKFGIIPLYWIFFFAALAAPLAVPSILSFRIRITPLVLWGVGYLLITILWYYPSVQNAGSFQDVQTRFLAVIVLFLMLFLLNSPADQRIGRIAVALSVLIAVALNVYELFNPMTFSAIPGRSSGLYTNVNQSGAALVLGMIIAYQIIPDRFKLLFIALTAIGIVTTFSRAAMLGWVLVVFYVALRSGIRVAQVRRFFILGVLVFGFIISPYWGELQHSLQDRGTLTLDVVQRLNFFGSGNTSDTSSQERSSVATYAFRHFSERPMTGFGTGDHTQLEGYEVGVHNVYLAMMVDHGIIGLFILPLMILAVLWGLPKSQIDLALPFAMFLSLWGLFSHNVLEERYILTSVALVGSIIATHRVRVTRADFQPASSIIPIGAAL